MYNFVYFRCLEYQEELIQVHMINQSQFPDPVVDQLDVNDVMMKEMNITHLTGIFIHIYIFFFIFYYFKILSDTTYLSTYFISIYFSYYK